MIAKMLKFHLFFLGDENKLLRTLQKKGIVEINQLEKEYGFENLKERVISIEEKINKIEFLKGIVKKIDGKEFSGKILLTESQEQKIISNFLVDETFDNFKKLNDEIERRKIVDRKIETIINQLNKFKNIKLNFATLFSLKNFSFYIFTSKKPISLISEDILFEKVYQDKKEIFYLIVFPSGKKEEIFEKIKENKGEIIEVKKWNKYPEDIIKKLLKTKKKNLEKINNFEKYIGENIKKIKNEIFVIYDHYISLLDYLKTKEKVTSSKFIKCFCGWIKEKDIEKLKEAIKETSPDSFLHIVPPQKDEDVPIVLENPPLIEPFEVVTDLYGRPIYKNMDPTFALSLFFVISFGFCTSDAGYGILLILLSLILMRKFKFYPSFIKFLKLLIYGGIGAIIIGALTGGWFGDIISKLPEKSIITKTLSSFIILDPLKEGNNALIFLAWALIIGYIQIIWGLILNLYNSIKNKVITDILLATSTLSVQIFAGVLVFLFLKGLKTGIFFYIPIFIVILNFLTIMAVNATSQKGLLIKGFWAIYSAYSVIAGNLLGDVLSYSRLFGLGLTSTVLAIVVNQIVFMAGGIPFIGPLFAVIIFLLGHFGNLAINLLGSYVHTSRLQYLEFFTKFYQGGGKPFSPFSEKRIYTYLKNF
ncbi:MAG TPA: V-type ATPase 116kDa subunit family protein [bacterium]|nr:V-type ATPase 116kDa subunit family protein [bacterium]